MRTKNEIKLHLAAGGVVAENMMGHSMAEWHLTKGIRHHYYDAPLQAWTSFIGETNTLSDWLANHLYVRQGFWGTAIFLDENKP